LTIQCKESLLEHAQNGYIMITLLTSIWSDDYVVVAVAAVIVVLLMIMMMRGKVEMKRWLGVSKDNQWMMIKTHDTNDTFDDVDDEDAINDGNDYDFVYT